MAAQNHSPTSSTDVSDLLAQITEHGTLFRIDGATGTYYVLSADQLMTLLRGRPDEVESVAAYTPPDFGLTGAEMSAYDTRRPSRRQRTDSARWRLSMLLWSNVCREKGVPRSLVALDTSRLKGDPQFAYRATPSQHLEKSSAPDGPEW